MTQPPLSNQQRELAQNFLIDRQTVRRLVDRAGLTTGDLLLEIGPGAGIITRELSRAAGRVVAIELDPQLSKRLQKDLAEVGDNIEVIEGDFLQRELPDEPYKIFANIPFNITAPIMLKLWQAKTPPQSGHFIMQKEAAEKFTAAGPTTESFILYQPWFEFEILASISRFEFRPVPSVDAVLLGMEPRSEPSLDPQEKPLYHRFVSFGFRSWKKSLKIAYKEVFSYKQWKRLTKDGRFALDTRPSELSLDQWLALYRYFLMGVAADKQQVVSDYNP